MHFFLFFLIENIEYLKISGLKTFFSFLSYHLLYRYTMQIIIIFVVRKYRVSQNIQTRKFFSFLSYHLNSLFKLEDTFQTKKCPYCGVLAEILAIMNHKYFENPKVCFFPKNRPILVCGSENLRKEKILLTRVRFFDIFLRRII